MKRGVVNLASNSAGELYAWSEQGDDLIKIDIATGIGTRIVSPVSSSQHGLAFDASDTLHLLNGSGIGFVINVATGSGTSTINTGQTAHHGDFDLGSGSYYGIGSTGGTSNTLEVVDFGLGVITRSTPTTVDLHTLTVLNDGTLLPSVPLALAVFDGTLYFSGERDGRELWRYDGTVASQVADINPGTGSSNPTDLVGFDGSLYFRAFEPQFGFELCRTAAGGVELANDINPGSGSGLPAELAVFGDVLYFQANSDDASGGAGSELWRFGPQAIAGAHTLYVSALPDRLQTDLDFGALQRIDIEIGGRAATATDEGSAVVLSVVLPDLAKVDLAWSVMAADGQPLEIDTSSDKPEFQFTPFDEGRYTVSVVATDQVSGESIADSVDVFVQNVVPRNVDSGPDQIVSEGESVNLIASFDDPGSTDLHTFRWQVDATNGEVVGDGSAADFSFAPSNEGIYTVTLTVFDDDGGAGSSTTLLTVENAAPLVTIAVLGPAAPALGPELEPGSNLTPIGGRIETQADDVPGEEGTEVALTLDLTDPGGGDTHDFLWQVVADNGQAIADGMDAIFRFVPEDEGFYTVNVTVTDDSGDVGAGQIVVDVANAVPTDFVFGGVPLNAEEGDAISLTGMFDDPGTLDTHTRVWSVSRDGQLVASGTEESFELVPSDDDEHTVTLTVTDNDGGVGQGSVVIPVANVGPVNVSAGPNLTVNEGDLVDLSATFLEPGSNDTHGFLWEVTSSNGQAVDDGSAANFSFVAADSGEYAVKLTVFDDDGASASDFVNVTVANLPPLVSLGGDFTVDEGAVVQLSPVVQDPAGVEDVLTYSWEVIASNGQAVADPMSPTQEFVASDDGSYVVTITVTDDDGALGSDTVAITVDNVAPLVAATLPLLLDEGESFQLLGSFVDPGADTHAGSIDFGDGRVEELRFSGQAFSLGHRFGDDGTYDVEVMVSDDEGGSGNQSFTVTVNDVAPLLEISGPASALVGAPYQLNFSVTEPGNDSLLQWSVNWGDGTLEMLSGSTEQAEHTYTAPGERTIEVSASDEDGTYLAPSVSVSVVPPAFQVLALTPNPSGFDVSFNRGFDSALLNLYDTETGGRGLADVTLVGDTVGGVAGSLVIGADALSFVATGDVLVPDTYTVELRSATDGFRDKFGEFLDGDMDSVEGGDYRASFSVGPLPSVVISVDDFMRGPGQSVDLPAAAQGIPLRVGDAAGIESLELQISYDPSLLVVEGLDLGAGVVTGSLSLGPQTVPGQLHIV